MGVRKSAGPWNSGAEIGTRPATYVNECNSVLFPAFWSPRTRNVKTSVPAATYCSKFTGAPSEQTFTVALAGRGGWRALNSCRRQRTFVTNGESRSSTSSWYKSGWQYAVRCSNIEQSSIVVRLGISAADFAATDASKLTAVRTSRCRSPRAGPREAAVNAGRPDLESPLSGGSPQM